MSDTRRHAVAAPWRTLLALAALGAVLVLYRPGEAAGAVNAVVLPLVALAAAWYVTGSVVAVSLATALLAAAHADPDSTVFREAVTYPAIATLAGAVTVAALSVRFARYVRRTRAARRDRRAAD